MYDLNEVLYRKLLTYVDHMYFAMWFFYIALSGNNVLDVIHRVLPTDCDNVCMLFVIIKISPFL